MEQAPHPSLDIWNLFFAGFAFIGIFYSLRLVVVRARDVRSVLLGAYLFLQSMTVLEYVLFWTKLIYELTFFVEISLLFPLLYGPVLLIYLNRSFGDERPLRRYFYHFIPFLVVLIFKIPFYLASPELKLYHTNDIRFGEYFAYYPAFMLWHLSIYCVILMLDVGNQSGVGFMRSWAKWLIAFFIAFVVLSFSYYSLAYFQLLSPPSDYIISLATCATIFLIAWYGHGFEAVADGRSILDALTGVSDKAKSVLSDAMIVEANKVSAAQRKEGSQLEKYQHSGLPKSLAVKLADDLEKLMRVEKLFHQNDLRLETLAEKLNTNKHFLSQVINQDFNMNFFEYINLKRIEEAKLLLRTTSREDLNIIEVAYAVGFNNKGTFNSVFKKVTGITPTEFRKQSEQLLGTRNN